MASRYWVGGPGSKSWADTANWSATLGGAGGASVPATGDSVYILDGRSSIDQGLNQSAVALALLQIGFGGSIGTSTTPLQIGLTAASSGAEVLRIYGTDVSVYITPSMGGISPLAQIFGNSGQVTFASGSSITGNIICGESGQVQFVGCGYSSNPNIITAGASVTFDGGISGAPSLSAYAGRHTSNIDMLFVGASASAYVSITGTAAVTGNVGVEGGGIYSHESSGTIAFIQTTPGGTATAARAVFPFTVTSSIAWVTGSLFQSPPVTITYTNPTTKYGFA